MNLLIAAISFSSIVGGIAFSKTNDQTTQSKFKTSLVKVIEVKGPLYGDITVLLNGKLATTGDCSPTIKLGLIKKNGEVWDTISDIAKTGVLQCGLGSNVWKNDTTIVSLLNNNYLNYFSKKENIPGTYCFTYIRYKRGKSIISSTNSFEFGR